MPHSAYVAADRATYTTIGTEYHAYVSGDETLTAAQKELRLDVLASWELRIRKAEEVLAK